MAVLGDRIDGTRAAPIGRFEGWYVFAGPDLRGVEIRCSTGSKPLAHLTPEGARRVADLLILAAAASERMGQA